MQQSSEPFLLSLLCSFSYTFKPLGHAFPARCPARVLLSRVSLGPFPLLRHLRPATPEVHLCDIRFVRWPLRYYGTVLLLLLVLHRLRLLVFPPRTAPQP